MRTSVRLIILLLIAGTTVLSAGASIEDVKSAKAELAKFKEMIERIEVKAKDLKLANTHFWADKVGDLSRDLIDILDEEGTKAGEHEIHKSFREMHGAYLNLRATVKHLPNPEQRTTLLKGTLEHYYKVHSAVYGTKQAKANSSQPAGKDTPDVEGSESDGLPQPKVDSELDGVGKIIKKK